MQPKSFAWLAALALLFMPTALTAQSWLKGFPTVDQVENDIASRAQGQPAAVIAGRQVGRFLQLQTALTELNGGYRKDRPRAVDRLYKAYSAAGVPLSNRWMQANAPCPTFGVCEKKQFVAARDEYYSNRAPAEEAASLYFNADVKGRYVSLVWDGSDVALPATQNVGARQGFGSLVLAILGPIGILLGYLPYLIVLLIGFFLVRYIAGAKKRRDRIRQQAELETLDKLIGQFGDSREAQIAGINTVFDERKKAVSLALNYHGSKSGQLLRCDMDRSLATMSTRDREALRSVLLLRAAGYNFSDHNTWIQALGIIYGDGKATIYKDWAYTWPGYKTDGIHEGVKWLIGGDGVEASVNSAIKELGDAIRNYPGDPVLRPLAARLLGSGEDMDAPASLATADAGAVPGDFLIIGGDIAGAKLYGFSGEGALITVAPPGAGKTQCHVIPNLLTWDGPALVLDVKGEIFASTSGWRAANVGPVFKFSPLSEALGHRYNPLAEISDDPDTIWQDSRFLADMLIVPTGGKDPFWESSARDMVTAVIAHVVDNKLPAERTMSQVLDIVHGIGWDAFVMRMEASKIDEMKRAGTSLGSMDFKMRDSISKTAQASLSAWAGNRIKRATAASDWRPLDLRNGKNLTVYICLNPNEIDSYASLLRVIIAQHIRGLTGALPDRDAKPILFILDELPRLRKMPPVEEALEIGRQYGIKLWMFTQSLGQLETAYENAKGMVGNCAVRMFMNPSLADGTAQKLSDDMGFRESVIDGNRVKRVEPNVLAGPMFKDKVLVMAANDEAGIVAKHFAHADAELAARMEIPPVVPVPENSNAG